jgi:hypothetical protein
MITDLLVRGPKRDERRGREGERRQQLPWGLKVEGGSGLVRRRWPVRSCAPSAPSAPSLP